MYKYYFYNLTDFDGKITGSWVRRVWFFTSPMDALEKVLKGTNGDRLVVDFRLIK